MGKKWYTVQQAQIHAALSTPLQSPPSKCCQMEEGTRKSTQGKAHGRGKLRRNSSDASHSASLEITITSDSKLHSNPFSPLPLIHTKAGRSVRLVLQQAGHGGPNAVTPRR